MLPCLVMVILVSYITGLVIASDGETKEKYQLRRKLCFGAGITILIGTLVVYKYLPFITEQLNAVLNLFDHEISFSQASWSVPIGISFFIFLGLSYIFDVYRGKTKPTKHLGKYALFIAFFPHIAQGPLDRSDQLLPQFDEHHHFDYEKVRQALVLIFFGVFKKVVIADRLAVLVDTVFGNVSNYSGLSCWIACLFYSFQIYCDFSGYTDIARGSAGLMGFQLTENFNTPYLATSIADFWRRWHISLSRWFRDYVYIPLGGNRVSSVRWAMNILIVFLVSGIWHGAAWTFILWGVLHGVFQITGKYTDKLIFRQKQKEMHLVRAFRILFTFILISLLWSLFRSASISDYFVFIKGMFSGFSVSSLSTLGMDTNEFVFSFALIGLMIILDFLHAKYRLPDSVDRLPLVLRWLIYLVFLFTIILFGRYGSLTTDSFIYFQF